MNVPNSETPRMTTAEANTIIKSMNLDEVANNLKPKAEESILESMSNERASKEPLPSIMNEVFVNNPLIANTSIGNVEVRKLKALDITILKLTDSPIYHLIMGDIIPDDSKNAFKTIFPDEEALFSLVYQFTHNPVDVYKLVKKDKVAFHERVMEEVGFIYTPQDVVIILEVIMNHIGLVNQARIQFDATDNNVQVDDNSKKNVIPPTTTNTTS